MISLGLQAGTSVPWVIPEKGKIFTTKSTNPNLASSYFWTQEHQKKQNMIVKSIPHIRSISIPGLQMPEVLQL